jgi:hypothetical protein
MAALYWFGVPDNVDSRFMLPIAMLALVPLAFVFPPSAPWRAVVHALYVCALLWMLVGVDAEIPATLPWFMGGWLSLRGLVTPVSLILLLAVGGISTLAWRTFSRYRIAALVTLIAIAGSSLAVGATRWCDDSRCGYFQITSIYLRPTFADGWNWVDGHIRNATIAYAGNNVPYPLAGPHLTNRVVYINIDRRGDWRFHDYARAARLRPAAQHGDLATPSGVLLPLPPGAAAVDAVRPRYERMHGDRTAWIENLRKDDVDFLFVSALSAYEIDFLWHTPDGFPIEDEWARSSGEAFTLAYENPQVRIYAVKLRGRPS